MSITADTPPLPLAGLTTGAAPFIENAVQDGRLFIEQPYDLYTKANHDAWRALFARMRPRWERYANPRFREGIAKLSLNPDRIPRLEEVEPLPEPAHRLPGEARLRLRARLRLLRLPPTPRVSHHDHDPSGVIGSTTSPSPISSTTSRVMSRCIPTAPSPTPSCVSARSPRPPLGGSMTFTSSPAASAPSPASFGSRSSSV